MSRSILKSWEHISAWYRQSPRHQRLTLVGAAVLLCLGIGWFFAHGRAVTGLNNDSAAIPVTIAQVKTGDFPVYLNGLGTVEPYVTVTVRSRVDGEVTKVNFRQGQMVNEGDVLVQIDPRPYQAALDEALAKLAQDQANLKNAQLDLQRYQVLAKQDAAARQQLDTQQATVDQLTAQIKGDQAAIDNARTQLDYTTIRSPLTGRTGFRLVDPGNIVHAADTTGIVTIVKLQPISVVFTAPEDSLPAINKAMAAGTVPVTALSSDGLTTLGQGRLALVNNEVDQASGTIQMKATFQNKDDALWPGLSVTTRLLVDTLKQVVVVPEDAIRRGPNGLYAFVVDSNNKAEISDVKVGPEGNGQSVVLQGLSPGQNVVIAGQYRLQAGSLVQPTGANSSPTPGKATPSASAKAS
jgi:membrane fusion protein, multidrug efflux system